MQIVDSWRKADPDHPRKKIPTARDGVGKRWQVRWRERGAQRKRSFDTRHAAEAWTLAQGRTIHEQHQRVTIGDLATGCLVGKRGLKQSTQRSTEQSWRVHVEPVWAHREVGSITHAEVGAWLGSLAQQSPSAARRAFVTLSGIIRSAVKGGIIPADVTAGISPPQTPKADARPLTVDQVARLAEECAPHQLVVWTLATTGVRFGELAGLRVEDLDIERRRLRVARSLSAVGGRLVESTPKSGRRRDVPLTPWLLEQLAAAAAGRDPVAPLLPTQSGGPWRASSWKRIWSGPSGREPGARDRAGLPTVRVHDLRHTAAVWAIESGAHLKGVQLMLGHASVALTGDLYGRFANDGLDDVAARLGDRIGR